MLLHLTLALILLSALLALWGWLRHRPALFEPKPSDLMIAAPHSDDCVVLASELAYDALADGCSIRIAYVTCSSSEPDDELAKVRQAEAIAAWASVDVPRANLLFLDLPQSATGRVRADWDALYAQARKRLTNTIVGLPPNAAVVLPAFGESHPDHRMTRELTLASLAAAGRGDLIAYEVPEYNRHACLLRSPRRAATFALGSLPGIGGWFRRRGGSKGCGFVGGPRALRFPPSEEKGQFRLDLFRHFTSQGGEGLFRGFGHRKLHRRARPRPDGREAFRWAGLKVGGRTISPSALVLWGAVLATAAWACQQAARLLLGAVPAESVASVRGIGMAACGALLGVGLVRWAMRKMGPPRTIAIAAMALGALSGFL